MNRLLCALALSALAGCGGNSARPDARPDPLLDEEPMVPGDRASLQMYLVLTAEPRAMQDATAVDTMWQAVRGETARYQPIHAQVSGVPGGYEVDVELDFADLPHPALAPAALAAMIAELPPAARAKAEAATLAVSLRSTAPTLPGGGQIRLVGAAALLVAERHDGIILDLLARRAWTTEDWFAELSTPALSSQQVRLAQRREGDRVTLLTRGNPKFGAPDLQMANIAAGGLEAARARFVAVQAQLIERGGVPGGRVWVSGDAVPLAACEGAVVEVACVAVAAPE